MPNNSTYPRGVLELVLADEATRRDTTSAARRARTAGLTPRIRLDTWDDRAGVRYDRTLWNELTSLRYLDGPHGACCWAGRGRQNALATALGHIAVRRRVPTRCCVLTRCSSGVRASRLDNSTEAEMRWAW